MATHGRRQKILSYRDQGGGSLEFHTEHWRNFTFYGGPVIVACVGPWGTIQVWARDEAEGRRVVLHACAAARIDPDAEVEDPWIITADSSGRSGAVRRFGVRSFRDGIAVSKRPGPDGSPEYVSS